MKFNVSLIDSDKFDTGRYYITFHSPGGFIGIYDPWELSVTLQKSKDLFRYVKKLYIATAEKFESLVIDFIKSHHKEDFGFPEFKSMRFERRVELSKKILSERIRKSKTPYFTFKELIFNKFFSNLSQDQKKNLISKIIKLTPELNTLSKMSLLYWDSNFEGEINKKYSGIFSLIRYDDRDKITGLKVTHIKYLSPSKIPNYEFVFQLRKFKFSGNIPLELEIPVLGILSIQKNGEIISIFRFNPEEYPELTKYLLSKKYRDFWFAYLKNKHKYQMLPNMKFYPARNAYLFHEPNKNPNIAKKEIQKLLKTNV